MRDPKARDHHRIPPRRPLIALALLAALLLPGTAPAATLMVTSTGDAGDAAPGDGACAGPGGCTLRAAIEEANALANGVDPDAIHFDLGGAGVQTITPASPLPVVTDAVVIDGLTQPGASANTLPAGTNAVLLVALDGSAAGPGDGLVLDAGPSVVRGLVVHGWTRPATGPGGSAIVLRGDGGHRVEGNFLGTDATGAVAVPNGWAGIVTDASDENVIGGSTPDARNLVSGNLVMAMDVTGAGNRILGNVVGLDATGDVPIPNERGIRVNGPGTIVGGATAGSGNVLSGNAQWGVNVLSGGDDTVILGNLIGTNAAGKLDRGNGLGVRVSSGALGVHVGVPGPGGANVVSGNNAHGIQVSGGHGAVIENNVVGSDSSGTLDLGNGGAGVHVSADDVVVGGAPNLIAFNHGDGIQLYGSGDQRNTFFANSIHSNGGLGIDIGGGGPTPNDDGDADIGGNGQQNFPILATVASTAGSTTVTGELRSTPDSFFQIDVYASAECDPSGFGEGADHRGTIVVQTDATGVVAFSEVIPAPTLGGSQATATATDAEGATSEFSPCVTASGPLFTTTTFSVTTTSVTSTTATTTPGGGTTTTTTLPIPCTAQADCDLADACRAGACVDGFCAFAQATAIPGVLCHATNLRRMLDETPCLAGCACPFDRRIGRVERRYGRALLAAGPRRCRRLANRGRRPTRKVQRMVARRQRDRCFDGDGAAVLDEASALMNAAAVLDARAACAP